MDSLDNFKKTQRHGIKSFSTDQKDWNFFLLANIPKNTFEGKKKEEENITVSSKNSLSPGYFSFSIL